jgi:hypothetical protein
MLVVNLDIVLGAKNLTPLEDELTLTMSYGCDPVYVVGVSEH